MNLLRSTFDNDSYQHTKV
uniref:Uncharacterized protein n=1 Tax=Anguilla anguilla TaxID=7936 RepID=A0A0E9T958_ANGAN